MAKRRRSRQFKEKSQVIDIEQARQNRRKRRKQAYQKAKAKQKNIAPVSKRRATKAARRRLIYMAIVVILIAVVVFAVLHLLSLQKAAKEEEDRKEALIQEKARLENELKQVNSSEYVEDKARTDLHMVKPGETIYVVPDSDKSNTTDQSIQKQEDDKKGSS